MRYIGSKRTVLPFIKTTIEETYGKISNAIVADLFAGTACVGEMFKREGARVLSNDYLSFSYALQIEKIKLNGIPEGNRSYLDLISLLNATPGKEGFFFREYSIEGSSHGEYTRNYFSKDNAMKIDGVRTQIELLRVNGEISEDMYFLLIANLIDAVTRVSNTSGTYGAFLKVDDPRKDLPLSLSASSFVDNGKKNECYCKDIFELIDDLKGDILYLDPPYNGRQYPPYYHILDTVTKYDNVALMGKSFNDKEGDADKWARTIISWLLQVGWVISAEPIEIYGRQLPRYTTTFEVDRVLQYNAKSTTKYVPQEMLCSDHHAFPKVVQERRVSIIKELSNSATVKVDDLLSALSSAGIEIDAETLKFDLINLKQAGINIEKELSYYRLADKIKLDVIPEKAEQKEDLSDVEKKITHYVTAYADTLPARLIDNLIRFGYAGTESAAQFEAAVDKFFKLMGYESNCLGQGHGRVADVIAKYKTTPYPRSYGLIIDAKAYAR